jgi:hypothetical protein
MAEAAEQMRQQKQILQLENDFFERGKTLENHRHNKALLALESSHAARVNAAKAQEQSFVRDSSRVQSQYRSRKRSLIRAHRHAILTLRQSPARERPDSAALGEIYAEKVAAELLRLAVELEKHSLSAKMIHGRLRMLVNEFEAYLQFITSQF